MTPKKCTKWWKGSNSCPNKKYITHTGLILKHVNVYIPKNIKQPLTFFISLLLRWVPIMIDLRQARDANIIRTLDGRHMTPWARNTSSKISKPGRDQRRKTNVIYFFNVKFGCQSINLHTVYNGCCSMGQCMPVIICTVRPRFACQSINLHTVYNGASLWKQSIPVIICTVRPKSGERKTTKLTHFQTVLRATVAIYMKKQACTHTNWRKTLTNAWPL